MARRPFGTRPRRLYRRGDPDTSRQAAHAVDTPTLEQIVYEAIRSFPEGCISNDLLRMFPERPYSSITARYSALIRKGYIRRLTEQREGQYVMIAIPDFSDLPPVRERHR